MRTIYLVRHGRPDFPAERPMCIGASDVPLGELGRLQSALAASYIAEKHVSAVFCSDLTRSRCTAEIIGGPVSVIEGLRELSAGEWDGLYFDEIREKWPELFAKRGEDPSLDPPGAEDRERGLRRVLLALETALGVSTGDIAVVGHKTAMQLLISEMRFSPLEEARNIDLPYGSVTAVSVSDGQFYVDEVGYVPHPELTETVCLRLLQASDAPVELIGHSVAVAREAMRIVCALAAAGVYPDENVVFSAACLHDIARREPEHPAAGGAWLRALGYEREAAVVERHHDLIDPNVIDEAAVVYIADKLVRGTERVTLERRFAGSYEKCSTAEAREAHERRYGEAKCVADAINKACGKEVIA